MSHFGSAHASRQLSASFANGVITVRGCAPSITLWAVRLQPTPLPAE